MRKSQAIASSQPPPNASELTGGDGHGRGLLHRAHELVGRLQQLAPSLSGVILVNSLMSAPAQNVKMFDEANTTARSFPSTSSHSAVSSRSPAGEIGLAGGRLSQTIADVAAGLQRDHLALLALVGLRVGEEALAGLLAQPALRHQALAARAAARSPRPTRTRRAPAPRAPRRGPARRRGRTGPGRMPAPIIIPISMSLAAATPSSSTRHDSTSAFSEKRSTSVSVSSTAQPCS